MSKWSRAKDILGRADDLSLADAVGAALGLSKDIAEAEWNYVGKPIVGGLGQTWDKVIKPVGSEILDQTHPKEWYGDAQYYLAKYGGDYGGLSPLDIMRGSEIPGKMLKNRGRKNEIIKAHDEGDGRAVWEYLQGDQNRVERGVNDMLIDPTTYLTGGGVKAGKELVKKGTNLITKGEEIGKARKLLPGPVDEVPGEISKVTETVDPFAVDDDLGELMKQGLSGPVEDQGPLKNMFLGLKTTHEGYLIIDKTTPRGILEKVVSTGNYGYKVDQLEEALKQGEIIEIHPENFTLDMISRPDLGTTKNAFSADAQADFNLIEQTFPKNPGGVLDTETGVFQTIKDLGGTTGGASIVTHRQSGERFVLKRGKSPAQTITEVVSDAVYRVTGINVPASKYYSSPGSAKKGYKLANHITGDPLRMFGGDEVTGIEDTIREGFAVDALLGNWDVIGLVRDNILVDDGMDVWRIDNGGTLGFRAQGDPKGLAWGPEVRELVTMRDEFVNPQAAAVFGKLSDEAVANQILNTILPNENNILKAAELAGAFPEDLSYLAQRIDYMKGWAGGKLPKPTPVAKQAEKIVVAVRNHDYVAQAAAQAKSPITGSGVALQVAGTGLRGIGRILQVTDLPNYMLDKAVGPMIGKLASTRPGRWISQDSATSVVRRSMDAGHAYYISAREAIASIAQREQIGRRAANEVMSVSDGPGPVKALDATKEEREAIRYYQKHQGQGKRIQDFVTDKKLDRKTLLYHEGSQLSAQSIMDNIDSAMSKNTLDYDTELWRGDSEFLSRIDIANRKVGDVFIEPGYMSTTFDPNVALDFPANFGGFVGERFILRVRAEAGMPGIRLDDIGLPNYEEEFLFPRRTKWRVTEITPKGQGQLTAVKASPHTIVDIEPIFQPRMRKYNRSPETDRIVSNIMSGKKINKRTVGDRIFERGTYAGKGIADSTLIWDARSKTLRDHNEALSAFGPKGGLIKSKQKRLKELSEEYGGMEVENPNNLDAMDEKNLRDFINLDPTFLNLDDAANAWLHDKYIITGDKKGQSYYNAAMSHSEDFENAKDLVGLDVKKFWEPQRHIKDVAHLVSSKKAKQAYNKYAYYNLDVLNADPEVVGFFMLERDVFNDAGIDTRVGETSKNIIRKMQSIHGDFAAMWKGIALISPRYHTGNVASNWLNVALTYGIKGMANYQDIIKQVKMEFDGEPTLYHQFASSQSMKMLEDHGLLELNRNISTVGIPAEVGGAFNSSERFWDRLGLGKSVGRATDLAINTNRKVSMGTDSAARSALFSHAFLADIETRIPGVTAGVLEQAQFQKLDIPDGISLLPFRDPGKLMGYYKELGFTEQRANRLVRNMANARNKSLEVALKPVHKAMFSYYKTPLDELIGKVVPFHYYASRVTALYAEELMRSPFLAINFARGFAELADTDQAGLSARQRGWLSIITGPAGMTLMANPDALLGVTKSLGMISGSGFTPEGETETGTLLRWMKAGGYGLFPWFDGMFNMMGAYGDTFEPDMLGIRHRAIIGSIVNEIVAETGGQPPEPYYAGANAMAREHISTWFSAFLPGWLDQPVMRKNNPSGTIAEATMDRAIENRILAANPGMTNQQLLDIMNDSEGDAYQEAWVEVARSGVATQLMSFSLPVSMKLRDSTADVRTATIASVYDYAQTHNNDYDPTGDAQFAADFKKMTGKDWKPGMFEKAQFEQDMAGASDYGRKFIVQEYNYRGLGTPLARKTRDMVNEIKYDGLVPPGYAKPMRGEEDKLSDQWLSRQPSKAQAEYAELKNLQAAFKVTHPEYGDYLDWRGQISYLVALVGTDGYSAYRAKVMAGNPNAAKYFRAKIADAQRRYPGKPLQAIEWLNMQTTSPDAFLAVTGQARAERDARAISTNSANSSPFDPSQGMVEEATPWNDQAQSGGPATPVDPYAAFAASLRN